MLLATRSAYALSSPESSVTGWKILNEIMAIRTIIPSKITGGTEFSQRLRGDSGLLTEWHLAMGGTTGIQPYVTEDRSSSYFLLGGWRKRRQLYAKAHRTKRTIELIPRPIIIRRIFSSMSPRGIDESRTALSLL